MTTRKRGTVLAVASAIGALLIEGLKQKAERYAQAAGLVLSVAPASADEQKALEDLQKQVKALGERVGNTITDALNEVKRLETLTGETNAEVKKQCTAWKEFVDANGPKLKELEARVLDQEQKGTQRPGGDGAKSPGQVVAESPQWAAASKSPEEKRMAPVQIGSFHKILNATGYNQPLVLGDRQAGIVAPADRLLTIRALIPVSGTDSNSIEYVRETAFVNAAAAQGAGSSPTETEGQPKAESNLTFDLQNTPVITLAHWIRASRQILSDAKMLQGHIDNRLRYGLKLKEEDQILNGDGTNGSLNGLVNQATAYNQSKSGDTAIDFMLRAMLQVALSNWQADGHVMNLSDWYDVLLLKDTQGRYLFGDPAKPLQDPRIWGLPVVPTVSMTRKHFLTGAFGIATELFDREDANVRISENVNDDFIRNMVRLLGEERIALAVYQPLALVTGTLP
jgi:HK97 family phage major capsid protein